RLDAVDRHEVHVVDAALAAIAVNQVDQAVANSLDRRDVELHRPDLALHTPGAELDGATVGAARILYPEGDGADAGTVDARKALGEAFGLGVDDEVDAALLVEQHVLGAVARGSDEAHLLEQGAKRLGVPGGVFDELEAVGAHRVGVIDDAGLKSFRHLVHGRLFLPRGPAGP